MVLPIPMIWKVLFHSRMLFVFALYEKALPFNRVQKVAVTAVETLEGRAHVRKRRLGM